MVPISMIFLRNLWICLSAAFSSGPISSMRTGDRWGTVIFSPASQDWIMTKKAFLRHLGIAPLAYNHVLISFLPNKDKNGRKFNVIPWETKALKLQGRLFRGATSYPGRGSYRKSDERGEIVEEGVLLETTRPVVSFIRTKEFNTEALKQVSTFLKQFKKQTRQDSVGLLIDGEMYYL